MPYITPDSIPEGTRCRPLYIPASSDWLAIVSGAITELVKTWNWEQVEGISVEDAIAVMQTMVEQYYAQENECMNANCPCPPIFRTGTMGQEQVSFDAGETWEDVEQPALPIPTAIAGSTSRCLSARNAVEVIFQTYTVVVEQFNDGVPIAVGIAAFVSTLALAIFFPPAIPIVWTFFIELWAALEFLTGGDWTGEVTEDLTCIIWENSEEDADGRWLMDFEEVQNAIFDRFADNPIWAVIYYILLSAGESSAQQSMQTRSIQSWDCTECEPPPDFIIYSEDDPVWTGTPCGHSGRGEIAFISGTTWRMTATQDVDTNWYVEIRRSDGAPFTGANGTVVSGATPTFIAANIQSSGGCNTGGGFSSSISPAVVTFLWAAASAFVIEFDF